MTCLNLPRMLGARAPARCVRFDAKVSTCTWVAIWALLLLVGGCASPKAPDTTPIEVKMPLAVPCKVDMPQATAFAVDALPLGANVWDQMLALRAERLQRKGYEEELVAAVQSCQ